MFALVEWENLNQGFGPALVPQHGELGTQGSLPPQFAIYRQIAAEVPV